MKLRLRHWLSRGPFSRTEDEYPVLGIMDPGPAMRIIESPDEVETVRRVPRARDANADSDRNPGAANAEPARTRPTPPPPLEAGYRWGIAAARQPCDLSAPASRRALPQSVEVLPPAADRFLPAPRFERAVLAVAARTDVLASAVARLQSQVDEIDDRFVDVVHHHDLVELESRRARLAAEVTRLSVELKAELDRRLTELGRVVAENKQRRAATVEHPGALGLADDRRVELHLDRLDHFDHLDNRQSA